ncbi:hypothetical protein MRX96_041413 [Rhipicephalus microplus]
MALACEQGAVLSPSAVFLLMLRVSLSSFFHLAARRLAPVIIRAPARCPSGSGRVYQPCLPLLLRGGFVRIVVLPLVGGGRRRRLPALARRVLSAPLITRYDAPATPNSFRLPV